MVFYLEPDTNLEVVWVPSEQNQMSDYLSSYFDCDDWGLTNRFFYYVNKMLGYGHSVDRFPNHGNTKLQRFNS